MRAVHGKSASILTPFAIFLQTEYAIVDCTRRFEDTEEGVVSTEDFVRRKNIERYRQMLEAGNLGPDERETIAKLLAEEERRAPDDCPGTGDKSRGNVSHP